MRRKEPYAGGDFYRTAKKLVGVMVYVKPSVRRAYKTAAARLKTSAQKLMARVLTKNVRRLGVWLVTAMLGWLGG